MKTYFSFVVLTLLVGCTTYLPAVPEGYVGDTAIISDSFKRQSKHSASVFYVKQINNKDIFHVRGASQGAHLNTMVASRLVPAELLTIVLVGAPNYSAPIGAVFNGKSNNQVSGSVSFTPKSDSYYRVNGRLSEGYSSVWIEDANGNVVTEVVESGLPVIATENLEASEPVTELNKTRSEAELFLSIMAGDRYFFVESKLGAPDHISEEVKAKFLSGRAPQVIYTYSKLGKVQFSVWSGKSLVVEKVFPDVDVIKSPADIDVFLGASDSATLLYVVKALYKKGITDEKSLDVVAEKIWRDRESEDTYTIKSVAYLCKIIAKSKNPRYRELLENTSNGESHSKILKYARYSLAQLTDEDVAQFTP